MKQQLAVIITSLFGLIGTLTAGWFVYNQSTKDKMTDFKIEQLKIENNEKISSNNRNVAIIYGEMYELRHKLNADRCFIIQPHPEHKHLYLSVTMEVDRKGISAVKDIFQNIPISDMAGFVKQIATTPWLYIDDVDKQVSDKKTQSLMKLSGSMQIVVRQLINSQNSWVGSLVIENVNEKDYDKEHAKEIILNSANLIQFYLPGIN